MTYGEFALQYVQENLARVVEKRADATDRESVKFRGQSGHAAFASALPRKVGYQRREGVLEVAVENFGSSLQQEGAPRGVHRI
jgi:hypothetical protein